MKMRYVLTFIAGVILCFLVDIHEAYSEPFNVADLRPLAMNLDLEGNEGVMIVEWQGFATLEEYEGRWLDLKVTDPTTGSVISLQFWVKLWSGVCAPPCELNAEVILQNVDWVTK